MWEAQVEALRGQNRVITYDLRGFGHSQLGTAPITMDVYADDLVALLDALALPRVTACGLSLGGYVLLNAVRRYSQRFSALVLADTQCLADTPEEQKKRTATAAEIDAAGLGAFSEKFMKNALGAEAPDSARELVRRLIIKNPPEAVKGALLAMAHREESCSHLHHMDLPVLVLCGEHDQLTTLPKSEMLFTQLPAAQMHIVEKAGHLANLEQPVRFNLYLSQFIDGLAKG